MQRQESMREVGGDIPVALFQEGFDPQSGRLLRQNPVREKSVVLVDHPQGLDGVARCERGSGPIDCGHLFAERERCRRRIL
jgi:hypothetical protein